MPRRSVLLGATLVPLAVVPFAPHAVADGKMMTSRLVNIRDHGAVGDGKTDDTAAIAEAFESSGPEGSLYFPPGTYVYNGAGLDAAFSPSIIGTASSSTKILLGPDSYFINYAGHLTSLLVRDLTFEGGKGAIKHSYTGVNVAGQYLIQNCQFSNYSSCAVSTDASDMPYWRVSDCIFESANTLDTIGIALSPGTDQCVIDSCSFIRNRIHIKARRGNNLHITGCDMLQFSPDASSGPRVAVWIVPAETDINAGTGLTITRCKFGNENLVPGDFRLLYADELEGASNGEMFPILDADSSNYVAGHNIALNLFVGNEANSHPIIFSTTPNVRSLNVRDNAIEGGQPSHVVEFRVPPSTPSRITSNSIFGPFLGVIGTENSLPILASNAQGVGYWVDPQGLQQRADSIRNWTAGSSASYRQILTDTILAFDAVSAAATATTDAYGGADAVIIKMNSAGGSLYRSLSVPFFGGLPVWVEFDVANPGENSAGAKFYAYVAGEDGAIHWRRCIEVPGPSMGWVSYAFCFSPRTDGQRAKIVFSATGESEAQKTFKVGRPRVYQANERQLGGGRPVISAEATTADEALRLVNDLRSKLISLGILAVAPSS